MGSILVVSCVLLDVITEDPIWYQWSSEMIEQHAEDYNFFINPIIYSEVSIGYKRIEELEDALPASIFKRAQLPWEAAFLAGKNFLKYRKLGGQRTLPLPDFFIGAHAVIDNMTLLTRDTKRFRHYYPQLQLITPKTS